MTTNIELVNERLALIDKDKKFTDVFERITYDWGNLDWHLDSVLTPADTDVIKMALADIAASALRCMEIADEVDAQEQREYHPPIEDIVT